MSSNLLHSTTGRRRVNVWRAPTILGLLTCFGLLSALLGSGIWNAFSWVALAIPLFVAIAFWVFPRNKTRPTKNSNRQQ